MFYTWYRERKREKKRDGDICIVCEGFILRFLHKDSKYYKVKVNSQNVYQKHKISFKNIDFLEKNL